MIKKKSSHFICTWQWLMLSSETMRRKLEIQKLERVFRFFHFHSYLPYFLNIKSSWIRMNIFEIYLLLLTAEDGWCFHTWSGAISWIRPLSLLGRTYSPGCRIGGSFLISYFVWLQNLEGWLQILEGWLKILEGWLINFPSNQKIFVK